MRYPKYFLQWTEFLTEAAIDNDTDIDITQWVCKLNGTFIRTSYERRIYV